MATKDDSPGGLLSKVVRFVKNPGTNWSDLDHQESERESSYSKQVLKEMIERKRRNDFVRKREFDMLRKMRRSEVMAGQDPAARPSFFQSSMPSKPDDRATTLKKIDEIEAQMSMQWWKTKHADSSVRGAASSFPMSSHVPPEAMPTQPRPPLGSPSLKSTAYTSTEPQPLPAQRDGEQTQATPLEPMLASVTPVTPAARPPAPVQGQRPQPPVAAPRTPAAPPQPMSPALGTPSGPASDPAGGTGFTASKLFAIDVEEFAHDPELEEASIRFANGDDAGAEAGLMEVLGPTGSRVNHDETWLTLFDLYRAIGKQDRYDTAAIEFAGRFGRSAPQWFSMPEIVGRLVAPAPAQGEAPGGQPVADWNCPPVFGTQTLAALNAALARVPQPWRLNWGKLTSIGEAAVEPLTRTFTQWASQPVQLRFIGAEQLEKVLKDATPSGTRETSPAWWKLRMEVLRVMRRPDEFELVALDYCVTYEVSPPSWDNARCEYKPLSADGEQLGGHTIISEPFKDSMVSSLSYSDTGSGSLSQLANVSTVELAGQILGDASEALGLLEARLMGADVMVISCARLIRIDFSAAGTLLNWVTARQAEGRQVQFVEVHRLVAAFFNVIGISEHARVIPRQD